MSLFHKTPADYVNPFIGTAARGNIPEQVDFATLRQHKPGNTFPGPVMPWGLVSISPHTTFAGDYVGCQAGYYPGERYIYGFSPNHLSGVGCPALGNCLIMPTIGPIQVDANRRSEHGNEIAEVGYYKTDLTTLGIQAEMTCTQRAAILRFTFPANISDANIIVDSAHRLSWCDETYGEVHIVSNNEFEGQSIFGHFCHNFMNFYGKPSGCETDSSKPVYFVGRIDYSAHHTQTWLDGELSQTRSQQGCDVGACFEFSTDESRVVHLKVGISYTSIENAWLNLETEIPHWDFDGVRQACRDSWNAALSRIEVRGGTEDEKVIFYTGLYHMLIHPSVFSDVNGEYVRLNSDEIMHSKDYTRYSIFSLWDTYRNVHPLLTLAYPEYQLDMVKSIVEMTQEVGRLPKWELCGLETGVMAGDPAVPVLVDTYCKGLIGFDIEAAYNAMRRSALMPDDAMRSSRPGLADYIHFGYVPHDKLGGSVSVTIDYSYADWSLAQLALQLGKDDDHALFLERSKNYQSLFDPDTGLFRPRLADGSWLTPFDPLSLDGFVENNAWQYAFTAHHDVEGYVALLGGESNYVEQLQKVFDDDLYDMTNEPDLAYVFLFNDFQGEAWRSQRMIDRYRKRDFGVGADGLCGNDDCGAISGWYVFSAMGLYPLRQGDNQYAIVNPVFDEIIIHLNHDFYNGEQFTIRTNRIDEDSILIDSIEIDGQAHNSVFIDHETITNGGEMVIGLRPDS